jgi:hypothetical protein
VRLSALSWIGIEGVAISDPGMGVLRHVTAAEREDVYNNKIRLNHFMEISPPDNDFWRQSPSLLLTSPYSTAQAALFFFGGDRCRGSIRFCYSRS